MRVPRRRRRRRRLPDWAPSAKISVLSASRIRPIVGAPASSYVTALHRKPLFVTELSSKPASTLSSPPGRLPAASWVLPRRARRCARFEGHDRKTVLRLSPSARASARGTRHTVFVHSGSPRWRPFTRTWHGNSAPAAPAAPAASARAATAAAHAAANGPALGSRRRRPPPAPGPPPPRPPRPRTGPPLGPAAAARPPSP